MDRDQRLLQRHLDGRLGRDEAAGLRHMLVARPDLASQAAALDCLDIALRAQATTQQPPAGLAARIATALPARPARAPFRLRLRDLIYANMAVGVVALTYAVLATITAQVQLLMALALVGLVGGTTVLILAGSLRRAEADALGRLLGRRIAIGRGDVLVYRTVGVALAVGGVWLAHTLAT